MLKNKIVEMVNDVFVEEFEQDRDCLKPETQIFQEIGLDSLDVVDLIVALQKKFGINLRNEESIREIRTLNDLYAFILTLKNDTANYPDSDGS